MIIKKDTKTARLKKFEADFAAIQKSKTYVENELRKIREKESYIRDKISKEKKAISLINKAKRLR